MAASFKSGRVGRSTRKRKSKDAKPVWLDRVVGIAGTVASILALFGLSITLPSHTGIILAVGGLLLFTLAVWAWWRNWFQPNQKTARQRFYLFTPEVKRSLQVFQSSYGQLASDIGLPRWAGQLLRWFVPKASFIRTIERKLILPKSHFEKGVPYVYDDKTTQRRLERLRTLKLLVWTRADILKSSEATRQDALMAAEKQLDGGLSEESKEKG